MLPAYRAGDVLVGLRWFLPRPGQVVVLHTPERHQIKRIIHIENSGIWLEGDNKTASTDSRERGTYHTDQLVARIVARINL